MKHRGALSLTSSRARGSARPKAFFALWLTLAMVVALALGASVALAAGPATLVDAGFESGAEGALLASPPWTAVGTPQHRDYDNLRARSGSQSAWIQGPVAASYAGISEAQSANMTADGSEIRFWVYQDTTNQLRRFYDNIAAGGTYGAHLILLNSDGTISVNVAKASPPAGYITGYTTVGTQAVGWTEYRIVHNFTNQTYTLSTRNSLYGAWTPLKSATAATYDIPMRGSATVTKTGGIAISGNAGSQLWLDDVAYSETGITDAVAPDTTAPTAPAALLAADHPADTGGALDLSWAAATDAVGVTGYKLYRGTAPGVYGTPTALGNVTSYTDATATSGTRYYYAVSALDAAGNESAKSPEAFATSADNLTPPTPSVDSGFENGAEGTLLATPPWSAVGTPQRREYDNTRAKNGAQSAWIQGPVAASFAGISEASSANMTADGAEIRFWMYTDTTNQLRRFYDNVAGGATYGAHLVLFNSDGTIQVNVAKASPPAGYITGYTTVGTQQTGWTQYRIIHNFTNQTYTLSTRTTATGAWTQLKSAGAATFDIPMRGSANVTKTGGLAFAGNAGSQLWLDDVAYSATGITEGTPPADTTAPTAPASLVALDTPADQGGSIGLSWAAASDNTAVTAYRVYRGVASGVYGAPVVLGNVTSYTDATAVTGTRYYYAVSALDAAGNDGAKSPEANAIATDNLPPATPTGLSALGGTASVTLTWNANSEADLAGYDVFRGGVKLNALPLASPSYTDFGLLASNTYSYRVAAVDTHGNSSAQCTAVSASPKDTTAPTVPASLSAVDTPADSGNSINITWAAASDDIGVTGYKLYRGTSSGVYGTPVSLGNTTAYTDATALTGTRYYYAVSAIDPAGNEGPKSPEGSAVAVDNGTPVTPPTPTIDSGFESGAEGTLLASPPWNAVGAPQHREYDNTRAKNGSQSAWIQGPVAASFAGISEALSANMATDGSEIRFWVYQDTTNQLRRFYDNVAGGATYGAHLVLFAPDGTIQVNVAKASPPAGYITGYTTVGTQAVGWTQYRIIHNFTNQTYTLSTRTTPSGAWTQLKSATAATFDIPMRGSGTVTKTGGIAFAGNAGSQLWLDDVAYSATGGITDPPATGDTAAPTAPATLSATDHSADSGGAIDLTWAAASDNVAVTGYRVYRGTAPGVYGAPTALGNVTTYTDNTAVTNTKYYYAVTARDAAGNEGPKSPEANATATDNSVVTPPGSDMSLGTIDCDSCHTATHGDFGVACGECHDFAVKHAPGTASAIHTPANVSTCTPCHNASLTVEHNGRKTTSGTAIDCMTCHGSTDPAVKAAITAKNSACSACHANANHAGMHGSDTSATPLPASGLVCGDCHASDIQVEHAKPTASSAALGCSACHPTPRNSLTPSWNKGCVQNGCHIPGTATEMHGATAAAHTPLPANSSCFGTGCHSGTDMSAIHSAATTTVAGDVRTSCMVCHAGGTPPSKNCTACHASGSYHATQDTKHTSPTTSSCFGAGCHAASKNIATVHAPLVGSGSEYPQYATSCDLCHKNANPTRINWATATARCTGSCHLSNHTGYAPKHTVTAVSSSCTAVGCHGTDLTGIHKAYDDLTRCGICHDKPTNFSKTADCVSCHNTASPHPTADASHTANPSSQTVTISGQSFGPVACADCHASTLLTTLHAAACTTCHPTPKNTLTPAWDKSCTQGGCHTPTSTKPMHASIDASHSPVAGQTCYVSGCHAASSTDSLAQTHRNASATLGESVRTGCQVCHWNGTPASRACDSCHANKVDGSHGYNVGTHTAADTCVGSCHSQTLSAVHTTSTCESCHAPMVAAIKPWSRKCSSCHSTTTHMPSGNRHAGNDIGAGSSYLGYGCSGPAGQTCHNIKDVSVLHANVHDGSGGCGICHAPGKTPRTSCVTCHASGWGADTSYMHHNNKKYLANSADATSGAYYVVDPPGGWDDNLSYYDCQYCHTDFLGGPTAPAPQPIPVYAGQKMWYSGLRSAAGSLDDTQLQIATITVPANASLTFMTNYDTEVGSDYGYVEVTTVETTWTPIPGTITTTSDPNGQNLGNGINGNSGGWTPATFDLSAYAGQDVAVRFRFVSDRWINLAGWAVDNIEIVSPSGVLFQDDAEAANSDLISTGWLRVGAYPPAYQPDHGPSSPSAVDLSHAPVAAQTCYAAGCHPSSGTDTLAQTHKSTTAVLGGKTRTGCQVCHWNGMPASGACASCHADKVDGTHGGKAAHAFTIASDASATVDAGCTNSGTGCHGTDTTRANFSTYHPTTGCISGACHTSPSKATYVGNGDCQSCHDSTFAGAPARADLAAQHYNETTHTATGLSTSVSAGGTASATCITCHDPSPATGAKGLAAQHTNITPANGSPYGATVSCVECHNDTRAGGYAQVLAGWTTNACSGCHSITSSAPQHGTSAPIVNANSSAGCGASGINCHSTYDVHALHKNAAGGCTLAGCHDATQQGAKPAIKTCGQADGCHETEQVDYHANLKASHTPAATAYCYNSGCHPASRSLLDVHAAYAGAGSPNPQYATTCALCHQNQNPNRVNWSTATTACLSCHAKYHSVPAGEPRVHEQGDAAHTPTSASSGCTTCHSTSLLEIHGGKVASVVACTNCHPPHGAPLGCEKCHASKDNWSKTADCVSCHSTTAPHGNVDASHTAAPVAQTISISGKSFGSFACSDCHSPVLTTVHGGSCTTCHPTQKDTLTPAWNKSCVQGACHPTGSSAAMHASIDASHAIPAARSDCLASGCHDAGATKPFADQSVAEIHTAATTTTAGGQTLTSCQVCHGAGITPSTDCLNCHPERANSHGFDAAQHTSAETCYGTDSACHSSELYNAKHVTSCTTCHASSRANVQAAISTGSTDCGSCHASASSRYLNDAGEAYVLAGAEHDVVNPQITLINLAHDAPANYAAPIVTWTTDRPTTSEVEYVITSNLPAFPFEYPAQYPKTTVGSASLTTTHSVSFPVTQLGKTYTYRIKTVDAAGKVSYSTDRNYYRWRATSVPDHNPSLPEPTLSGLSVDELNLSIIMADGSTVATGAVVGWESQSAANVLPTPTNPGSLVAPATVKWTDHSTWASRSFGTCWKTNLATTEGSANWQVTKFKVDPSTRPTLRDVDLSFLANGELADGHPVTLRIWDFQSQQWVKIASRGKFEYYYNYAGQQRPFNFRAPTDPKQAFCVRCHTELPPAGVDWVARTDISQSWIVDVHGDAQGTKNATTVIGYGGTLKAPYVRGNAAISCDVCHTHGSSNSYNLKTTVNGSAVSVQDGVGGESLCGACHEGTPNDIHAKCITCHNDPARHHAGQVSPLGPKDFTGSNCFDCHRHSATRFEPIQSCSTGAPGHGCHITLKTF